MNFPCGKKLCNLETVLYMEPQIGPQFIMSGPE